MARVVLARAPHAGDGVRRALHRVVSRRAGDCGRGSVRTSTTSASSRSSSRRSCSFVFPLLVVARAASVDRRPLMFPALLCCSWRDRLARLRGGTGILYFIAAFLALATEAVWSAKHLTHGDAGRGTRDLRRLRGALSRRAAARATARASRCCPTPAAASCCCSSLCAVDVSVGRAGVAGTAIWGLAFLLAILNAALFIESAAAALPVLSSGRQRDFVARAAGRGGAKPQPRRPAVRRCWSSSDSRWSWSADTCGALSQAAAPRQRRRMRRKASRTACGWP